MSISSESAEQITRMMLEGEEMCLKATGVAAKQVLVLIAIALKNKTQTKGKIRLNNLLKSGKELKVFSVKQEDLKKFTSEAKRYGVLYCALVNNKDKKKDGMVDILVRTEDASRVNRIVERFNISTIDTAKIKTEILKTKENKDNNKYLLFKKESPSKNLSKQLKEVEDKPKKKSVKAELKEIKEELVKKTKKSKVLKKGKNKNNRVK